MNDASFLSAFEAGRFDSLDHEAHVRLAWIVLREKPLPAAIEWLASGLKKFADAKGKPEVYHETITWAFAILINERIERSAKDCDWEQFVADNRDLLRGRAILDDLYRGSALNSELARRTFVLPTVAARD